MLWGKDGRATLFQGLCPETVALGTCRRGRDMLQGIFQRICPQTVERETRRGGRCGYREFSREWSRKRWPLEYAVVQEVGSREFSRDFALFLSATVVLMR